MIRGAAALGPLLAVAGLGACALVGSGSGGSGSPDDAAGAAPTVEELKESGPSFTEYDVSPRLRRGRYLDDLLDRILVPVVTEKELDPDTRALFWVLVNREGRIEEAVLQTTSGSDQFDTTAAIVARRLRYRPARRDDAPVPVWVLVSVSILMG